MSSYLEYQKLDIGSVCAWRICAFQAGQESELQPAIVKPEGEYSSLEIIQRYITDGFKVRLNLEFCSDGSE